MSEFILTHHRETVFEIALNRPDKRNAINHDMMRALKDAVGQAERAAGVRAIVLRGEGGVFSSGIDVASFLQMDEHYGPNWTRHMRAVTDDFQGVLTRLERVELPTLALLEGYCLGLGLELALACDLRLAAEGTQLGLPESRLGIIPDVGGTTRLTRLVGPSRAKEIIFSGKRYDAAQAGQWGFVNYVVPAGELQAEADSLIADIAQAAPLAVGMAKRVIDGLADVDRGLMLEGWAQSQLMATDDFREAVQAFVAKRQPEFKGK